MIKWFKEENIVKTNISKPYWFVDENGNEINQLPTDFDDLKQKTIDTLLWLIGQSVKTAINGQDVTRLAAANAKAVVLNVKILTYLLQQQNKTFVDLDFLTEREKQILEKEQQLAESGYSDSDLLLAAVTSVIDSMQRYNTLIMQANSVTTKEELVQILESL